MEPARVTEPIDVVGVLVIDDEASVHEDFERHLATKAPTAFDELRGKLFQRPGVGRSGPRLVLHHCDCGEDAIALLETPRGDGVALAFVDMRMGGGATGLETLAMILERRPDIHLVLCTAYSDFTWDRVLAEVGAETKVHLLRKPFEGWQARRFAEVLARKWCLERARHADGVSAR